MEELISRVMAAGGIDQGLAQKAVGMILGFLKKEGPADSVSSLMDALPGAEALVAESAGGGGVMGLGAQMMGAGMSMGQIQSISKEVFAFGREKAGEDAMGAIVGAIPGLGQFV